MCLAYQSGGKTTYKILNTSSAEDVNKIFKDTMGYEPPYKPGTSVTEIQLTENATYVRVYDKVNSKDARWLGYESRGYCWINATGNTE